LGEPLSLVSMKNWGGDEAHLKVWPSHDPKITT
jgi:hypothetical protein